MIAWKIIKASMVIARTEIVEHEICDKFAKSHIVNKACILLIQNGLDITTIDYQDE